METSKLSLVFAISGFIYTAVLIFIFFLLFGIHDLSALFQEVKDYLPYISIIIFFLAFVIGIIFESILQKVVFIIRKKSFDAEYQIKIMMCKSEIVRNSIWVSYDKLIILRHFIVGPILLMFVLSLWILSSEFVNKGIIILYIIVSGGIIIILSFIAYLIRRTIHRNLEKAIEDLFRKQDIIDKST